MTTRHIIAYSMIAALVVGAMVALWLAAFRDQWRRRRNRYLSKRDRVAADGPDPIEEQA